MGDLLLLWYSVYKLLEVLFWLFDVINILLRDMDSEGSLKLYKSLLAVTINGGN